jgi:glycosyltransferase involved in cell wall biosynthesis
VQEGGLLETIEDGITGKLIRISSKEQGILVLKNVISETSKQEWRNMREASIKRAQSFSLEKFQENLQSHLQL